MLWTLLLSLLAFNAAAQPAPSVTTSTTPTRSCCVLTRTSPTAYTTVTSSVTYTYRATITKTITRRANYTVVTSSYLSTKTISTTFIDQVTTFFDPAKPTTVSVCVAAREKRDDAVDILPRQECSCYSIKTVARSGKVTRTTTSTATKTRFRTKTVRLTLYDTFTSTKTAPITTTRTRVPRTVTVTRAGATVTETFSGAVETPAIFVIQVSAKNLFAKQNGSFIYYLIGESGGSGLDYPNCLALGGNFADTSSRFKLEGSKLVRIRPERNATIIGSNRYCLYPSESDNERSNLTCSIDCLSRLQCSADGADDWTGANYGGGYGPYLQLDGVYGADDFDLKISPFTAFPSSTTTRRTSSRTRTTRTTPTTPTDAATATPSAFLLQVSDPLGREVDGDFVARRKDRYNPDLYLVKTVEGAGIFFFNGTQLSVYTKGKQEGVCYIGSGGIISCYDPYVESAMVCRVDLTNRLLCKYAANTDWGKRRDKFGGELTLSRKGDVEPFDLVLIPVDRLL